MCIQLDIPGTNVFNKNDLNPDRKIQRNSIRISKSMKRKSTSLFNAFNDRCSQSATTVTSTPYSSLVDPRGPSNENERTKNLFKKAKKNNARCA